MRLSFDKDVKTLMKLGILSCRPDCYSTRRLVEAANSSGHQVEVLDTRKFSIELQSDETNLYYRQEMLSDFDVILPRIGASITYFGTAVLRQIEKMDVLCANSSIGILNARDRLQSLEVLSRHHIEVPPTTFLRDHHDVLAAIERVGGAPVVIKFVEGAQRSRALVGQTAESAANIVESLQSQHRDLLIQKFVSDGEGSNIRAFVVGDQVVAAMRGCARRQELRTGVQREEPAVHAELRDEHKEIAVRAAQIMGLHVASVDLLEGAEGLQVMELSASPGLEEFERCTQRNIAGSIVDYLAGQVDFCEIDVHRRLKIARGYGVADLEISDGSPYVGSALEDIGFLDGDINVLALHRDGKVIPNPSTSLQLLAGDRLVCFGKLELMRELIPASTTAGVPSLSARAP